MFRTFLWETIVEVSPPLILTTNEYLIAVIVCVFFGLLYFGFTRIIYYLINPQIEHAKYGAIFLSASLMLFWVIASLDLLGFYSTIIALVILVLALIFDMVYLIVTRPKGV
ncbi:hypothetical protein [Candidatus Magnetobacterium casense]|uniref:Uncharacterized protein n=1 Tax=Candidatus Magnetobacterium casense TaxID=1455061 RepID=A0ABS6RY24_9BACT|nr:hypothetical protein [Candidatus Magnetobacterium casensis]MBV6341511.1 hypothetical protein [Candidatus Magnetobacterium casensis]